VAAYGLGWWDRDGAFHDEVLKREPMLTRGAIRVSMASRKAVVFGPPVADHARLVAEALRDPEGEVWEERDDRRVLALRTYDEADRPVGAVLVTAATGPTNEAALRFAGVTLAGALALVLLGLVVGQRLSRRILEALEASIRERERVLDGAAHELRTPVATMLAAIDAAEPDEAPETLAQVRRVAAATGAMVDRLLTWSRLAHQDPALEAVRLDLLVEVCLEDDEPFEGEAVVVQADPRLLRVAVENLLRNARAHGGGVAQVRVVGSRVEVHDHGAGVPDSHVVAPFSKGAASGGTGLGLALVGRIAEKHGGTLHLRPVVALELPPGAAHDRVRT
jgi:signal transduction histidine kinase